AIILERAARPTPERIFPRLAIRSHVSHSPARARGARRELVHARLVGALARPADETSRFRADRSRVPDTGTADLALQPGVLFERPIESQPHAGATVRAADNVDRLWHLDGQLPAFVRLGVGAIAPRFPHDRHEPLRTSAAPSLVDSQLARPGALRNRRDRLGAGAGADVLPVLPLSKLAEPATVDRVSK